MKFHESYKRRNSFYLNPSSIYIRLHYASKPNSHFQLSLHLISLEKSTIHARAPVLFLQFFFRIMQYICMKAVFLAAKAMILLVLVLSSFPTLAPARTSNMMPTSGTHKVYLPQSNRPVAPSSPDRCTYIPTPAGAPGHCGLHR
jgi:hypothetical protein